MARVLVDRLVEVGVNAFNGNVFPIEDHFWLIGNDSYAQRRSYLHMLDRDFQLIGERTFLNQGQEDHRLLYNEGTYHVWSNWADGTQMHYGKLDMQDKTVDVSAVKMKEFELKSREKNWCPFVRDKEILVVYSLYPEFVILRFKYGVHERIFSKKSEYIHNWAADNLDFDRLIHIGGGSNFIEYRGYFIGTCHAKYEGCEYLNFIVIFTPEFVVKAIIEIDYGESLFKGERLRMLRKELGQDKDESVFFVAGYRQSLTRVAFTTGLFLKDDKFHISLGVNDLVTKVAVIGKEKIDREIHRL